MMSKPSNNRRLLRSNCRHWLPLRQSALRVTARNRPLLTVRGILIFRALWAHLQWHPRQGFPPCCTLAPDGGTLAADDGEFG